MLQVRHRTIGIPSVGAWGGAVGNWAGAAGGAEAVAWIGTGEGDFLWGGALLVLV